MKEDKQLKSKQEDQDQEPSQEDESDKTHNLEIIHPTSQPKPRITFETILFKCYTFLRKNPITLYKSFSPSISSQLHAQSFVQISLRQIKNKLKLINTFCLV
jgi:hypothetical protein